MVLHCGLDLIRTPHIPSLQHDVLDCPIIIEWKMGLDGLSPKLIQVLNVVEKVRDLCRDILPGRASLNEVGLSLLHAHKRGELPPHLVLSATLSGGLLEIVDVNVCKE